MTIDELVKSYPPLADASVRHVWGCFDDFRRVIINRALGLLGSEIYIFEEYDPVIEPFSNVLNRSIRHDKLLQVNDFYVHVEFQRYATPRIINRMINNSSLTSSHLWSKGDKVAPPNIIGIAIVDENIFANPGYHEITTLCSFPFDIEKNFLSIEQILIFPPFIREIHTIQLKKFQYSLINPTESDLVFAFLKATSKLEIDKLKQFNNYFINKIIDDYYIYIGGAEMESLTKNYTYDIDKAYVELEIERMNNAKKIRDKDNMIRDRDNMIRDRDNMIRDRDNMIKDRDNTIVDKDNTIVNKDNMINDKDNTIILERLEKDQLRTEIDLLRREILELRSKSNGKII